MDEITKTISIRDRSIIDTHCQKISEESLESYEPAYMCCVDMTKAFDRVRGKDILLTMRTNHSLILYTTSTPSTAQKSKYDMQQQMIYMQKNDRVIHSALHI